MKKFIAFMMLIVVTVRLYGVVSLEEQALAASVKKFTSEKELEKFKENAPVEALDKKGTPIQVPYMKYLSRYISGQKRRATKRLTSNQFEV